MSERDGAVLRLPGGEEIPLSQVSVLRLGPSDCLVVKASKPMPMEARERLHYLLRQTFGEMVRFLILGPETSVEVVRTEPEQADGVVKRYDNRGAGARG